MISQSLPGLGGFPPAPPVFKKITKAFQKGNYTESDGMIALYMQNNGFKITFICDKKMLYPKMEN